MKIKNILSNILGLIFKNNSILSRELYNKEHTFKIDDSRDIIKLFIITNPSISLKKYRRIFLHYR